MARRKDTITLEDPRALRALAHPARQALITELFGGRVLTATEAADLVGLSPSAVSHHLRALEKWGLARRAAGSGDARERPWEGTARALQLRPTPGVASQAAMQSVMAIVLNDLADEVNTFMAAADSEPWKGSYTGLARGELWLTQEETQQLVARVQEALDEFAHKRTAARHPKGARRTGFTWSLVPKGPVPE